MSGPEQYPSHQHRGDSHSRIFGNVASGESTAAAASQAREGASGAVGGPSGRRRRWVRTRTQHLSSLCLENDNDVVGDHAAAAPARRGLPLEDDDGPPSPPPAPLEPMAPSEVAGLGASPTCGRYAYRRPDGNPVTGEGYGHLESCEMQAVAKK